MNTALNSLIHDLNNDLTILNGIVDMTEKMMEKNSLDGNVRRMVGKLRIRISNMSGDLKRFNESDESIEIGQYLTQSHKELEDDFEIKINLIAQEKFSIITNQCKLSMFIKNILKNAKEAGADSVTINCLAGSISFSDNGQGIPANILDKIANNQQVTNKINGQGLGIISLKNFCKQHHLNFSIQNNIHAKGCQISIFSNK